MAWLVLLIFAPGARALDGAYARSALNLQDAATYRAHTTSLSTGYRAGRAYSLGATVDLTRRRYFGGPQINDDQYYLTGSRAFGEHVYLDGAVGGARTADIFAERAAYLAPHFVHSGHDVGLGVRYAEYRNGRTGTVSLSYLRYLAGGLALGAATYVVRAESSIASYSAQTIYQPNDAHLVRLTGAAGRTLEDRGLEAAFNSLNAEYTYVCPAGFSAGLGLTEYWSQVRRERVLGFRLGWR